MSDKAQTGAYEMTTPNAQLLALLESARDLLTERKFGNPARSTNHNARLEIDKAIEALTAPATAAEACIAALESELRKRNYVGGMLANLAFNLSQGVTLTVSQRRQLDETRKEWDAIGQTP